MASDIHSQHKVFAAFPLMCRIPVESKLSEFCHPLNSPTLSGWLPTWELLQTCLCGATRTCQHLVPKLQIQNEARSKRSDKMSCCGK